jgi:SAM-dependent methyltransferase
MESTYATQPAQSTDQEAATRRQAADRALAENPELWYHTIELAPGLVTPGYIDLRKAAPRVLPDEMAGRRVLDIGTFDGFWAFEMERRGAEVVAIDLDHIDGAEFPPLSRPALEQRTRDSGTQLGHGFRLASEALGSSVERVVCNVYDVEPDRIGGPVDLAFNGATLTHLRDPIRALERVRDTLVPGGELISYEPISLWLTLRAPRRPAGAFRAHNTEYTWWEPNIATIHAWMRAAGFGEIRRLAVTRPPSAEKHDAFYIAYSGRRQ